MTQKEIKNPWTTLSAVEKYQNRWIKVTEYQVINPAGGKGIYGKIHFKNKGIGIIPIDEQGNTWLVGQYRYTLDEFHWEIPEGGGPLQENPLEAAKRELKEETGLTAKKWTSLLRMNPSNSVSDEECVIYLAEGLEHGDSELEETEADLKVRKIPLKEAIEMVVRGEIADSMSMIGLLMVGRIRGL
ncbi:MAG: NUDIX hydrolase [Cyclobacteriaceae bacterium]|nr:NUDIX hydrolase [Cyclobacteriaceae bacterium]MDH4295400.1 NUDIX hydrolase [Cyclobacteriaceae bacterium]MDH5249612.1 NUDIX hydrolase [Cyclobacteriaceae bacterium]